jgi:purine-binding chemotaxis protein CheW
MSDDQQSSQQYVVFRLDQGMYALRVENVVEVLRMVAITAVPKAPAWLSGVINLRGRVVPVIDLRARIGLPVTAPGLTNPILIVDVKGRIVGLIADRIEEVAALPASAITRLAELTVRARPVAAIARFNDRLILIFDLPRLTAGVEKFSSPEDLTKEKHELASAKA